MGVIPRSILGQEALINQESEFICFQNKGL